MCINEDRVMDPCEKKKHSFFCKEMWEAFVAYV